MDDAKRAIECALVNPRIRTVLIRGGPGTAKTVLSRAMGGISGRRIVNIPLNVTYDQLFGGMDMDSTVREGRAVAQNGLLSRADGGIVYVDDINLMDQAMLSELLDSVVSGHVVLEREGVSSDYSFDSILVATMNPSDSDISPHLLDRFDVCAYAIPPDGEGSHEEILRRSIAFSEDPEGFREQYSGSERKESERIARARRLLPLVRISDDLLAVAVELTAKVGADGFRGDLAMVNASMALTALDDRDEVVKKDVEEAAMICLAHRRNPFQQPPPAPPEPPEEQDDDDSEEPDEPRDDDAPRNEDPQEGDDTDREPPQPPDMQDFQQMLEDMVFEIGEQFRVIDYLGDGSVRILRTSSRKGRRAMAESSDSTGRYCRSRIPDGKTHDLAFDATIRAAAPYQRTRDHGGLAISIQPQDIREKVRERRSGCTILFLVDASGSLGARKRMSAVKGAVLSMLRDSYVKRDRVGMMAFRRDSAELILPPTRSVEYSYRKLEELPTGGKTPLSDALITVGEFMTSYSRSHQGEACYVVLISDGRGNVTFREGSDPKEEALRIAEGLKIPQVRWIVIDAGLGYLRFDHAVKLAKALEGTYFRLDDLDADRLADSVRAAIRRSLVVLVEQPGLGGLLLGEDPDEADVLSDGGLLLHDHLVHQVDVLHGRVGVHEPAVVRLVLDHPDDHRPHGPGPGAGVLVADDGLEGGLAIGRGVDELHADLGDLRVVGEVHALDQVLEVLLQLHLIVGVPVDLGDPHIGDQLRCPVHVAHVADLEVGLDLEFPDGGAVGGDDHVLPDEIHVDVWLDDPVVAQDGPGLVPLPPALAVGCDDGVHERYDEHHGKHVAEQVV